MEWLVEVSRDVSRCFSWILMPDVASTVVALQLGHISDTDGVTTGSQTTQIEWYQVILLPTPTHTPSIYTDITDTSVRC
jgi:hypothetical protein